ncbi:hypothetical protein QVD17_16885 [Tagetes erecta]|uniref:Non-specific lipid-transfer protein n=1 Tax=Tagetes erecta TaxID=13708 RepID=A0AAD8NZU6_TARER|nr:hypothetical protein QVD17_16885 [Tagetes erecta]
MEFHCRSRQDAKKRGIMWFLAYMDEDTRNNQVVVVGIDHFWLYINTILSHLSPHPNTPPIPQLNTKPKLKTMASMLIKMACVVLACMVVLAPHAEATITCGQVVSTLIPCLTYLRNGGAPAPSCCAGVRSLNSAARTTPDRKTACGCLKNSYKSNPGINSANAASLPSKCGVNIPYKISPNTDCSKVQ